MMDGPIYDFGVSDIPPVWVRPSDWLPLPAPGPETFIGLLAVTNDDSNYIALNFAGNYTVDWGDGGAPENVASGVQAVATAPAVSGWQWFDDVASAATHFGVPVSEAPARRRAL